MLGLPCWAQALSSWGKLGLLFVEVHGPLTVGASLVAEHGSKCPRASVVVTLGLRGCGWWA